MKSEILGMVLRLLRLSKDLEVEELAKKLNKEKEYVERLEEGEITIPVPEFMTYVQKLEYLPSEVFKVQEVAGNAGQQGYARAWIEIGKLLEGKSEKGG